MDFHAVIANPLVLAASVALFAVVSIWDFEARLAEYDWSMSGPFAAVLMLEPELLAGSLVETLRPLGFINLYALATAAGVLLGIPASWPSYVLVVVANVTLVLSLRRLGLAMGMSRDLASISAVTVYLCGADGWSFAVMNMARTYPQAGAMALALVPAAVADALQARWGRATVFVWLITAFHVGHGLFVAACLGLLHLIEWRDGGPLTAVSLRLAALLPVGLAALAVTSFVYDYHPGSIPSDVLADVLHASPGHLVFWRNGGFPVAFSNWLAVAVAGIILARWPGDNARAVRVVVAVFAVGMLLAALQVIGLLYRVDVLAAFCSGLPARATGYLPLLFAVPVAGALWERLERREAAIEAALLLSWMLIYQAVGLWFLLLWMVWRDGRTYQRSRLGLALLSFGAGLALCVWIGSNGGAISDVLRQYLLGTAQGPRRLHLLFLAVVVTTLVGGFHLMSARSTVATVVALCLAATLQAYYSSAESRGAARHAYELERWMHADSDKDAVFLVPDAALQQNSIAKRRTVLLKPGLLTSYRTDDPRTVALDRRVHELMGIPLGKEPGWYGEYRARLTERFVKLDRQAALDLGRAFGADYLVTYTGASPIDLASPYENSRYVVYQLAEAE